MALSGCGVPNACEWAAADGNRFYCCWCNRPAPHVFGKSFPVVRRNGGISPIFNRTAVTVVRITYSQSSLIHPGIIPARQGALMAAVEYALVNHSASRSRLGFWPLYRHNSQGGLTSVESENIWALLTGATVCAST